MSIGLWRLGVWRRHSWRDGLNSRVSSICHSWMCGGYTTLSHIAFTELTYLSSTWDFTRFTVSCIFSSSFRTVSPVI
ncbi:MAG: hypothetical protein QXI27_06535, partial [Nitrososphaerota archaeon]